MRDSVNSFLDEVCLHIRAKQVHGAVRGELKAHIDELADSFEASGMSRAEAEERAVTEMGSAEEIGIKLNRQHRPRIEWSLVGLTALLAVLGMLINRSQVPFFKQLSIAVLGAAVLVISMAADYTRLKKLSLPLFVALTAAFVLTPLVSLGIRGTYTYRLLGITAMAVFFTQLFFPLLAGIIVKYCNGGGVKASVGLAAAALAVMALSALLGRLSYVTVYALAFLIIFVVLFADGWFKPKRLALIPVCTVLASVPAALIFGGGVFRARKMAEVFLTRGQSDPTGSGYVTANIADVLKNSKPVGLMEGGLPDVMQAVRGDFTLTETIGKFGWLAGIAVIAVVAVLLVRMFTASSRIKGEYGRCLSLCCCALLCAKFAVNILFNLNLMPYMGVTLPLLGMGGTDYIITMFLIGTVLSVYRRNNLFPEAAVQG